MVFPFLAAAGGAAQLGSMGLNMIAQGQVDAARKAAMDEEERRQSRWDSQISGLNQASLNLYDGTPAKMADRAQTVADYYKGTGGSLPSSGVTTGLIPTSGNAALAHEGTQQMAKVGAFNTQQGHALGNLRSFGDVMGDNSRGVALNSAMIGGIDSMKRGSSNVLPLELKAANNAGNGMKSFADILGGLGKAGVSAGLGGGSMMGSGGGGGLFGVGDPFSDTVAGPAAPGLFTRAFG